MEQRWSPNYLVSPNDALSQSYLADVNASLPEGSPLPQTHPEYLATGNEANLVLQQAAEVWVTFVHEGAGYRNSLGFSASRPASARFPAAVTNHTLIFPNARSSTAGRLVSGNKCG